MVMTSYLLISFTSGFTAKSMDIGWPMPPAPLLAHTLIFASETAEKNYFPALATAFDAFAIQVSVLHHAECFIYQLHRNQRRLVNAGLLQEALRDLYANTEKTED